MYYSGNLFLRSIFILFSGPILLQNIFRSRYILFYLTPFLNIVSTYLHSRFPQYLFLLYTFLYGSLQLAAYAVTRSDIKLHLALIRQMDHWSRVYAGFCLQKPEQSIGLKIWTQFKCLSDAEYVP